MFEVYATTPSAMYPGEVAAHAQRAETMGYDGLSVPDAVHDGLLLSAMALNATERIKVITGVLVAFPRSPMNVAIAAWDLQKMSGGRFELGLGTQVKGNIEKRYSTLWTAPVPRMREYIASLRAIFECFQNNTRLDYRGELYQFTKMQPFFNPGPIEHPHVEIFLGAVGPLMTALAGEVASGMITHPTNTPPRYIQEVAHPRLTKGADKSGRQLHDIKLILGATIATGRDKNALAKDIEKQRNLLGFLYSTPAYWPSLELFGWQDKGQKLLEMTRSGNWQDMVNVVDDAMMDQFVPSGCYHEIADVLKKRYRGLSTMINFPLPDDPRDDPLAARVIAQLKEC
jgi:probable F420-dependent oxidoreductase